MIKIGILSMQRVKNYGSFLQAFALKRIIEDNTGIKVEFVDFKTERGIKDNAKESLGVLRSDWKRYYMLAFLYHVLKSLPFNLVSQSRRAADIVNLFSFYDVYCSRFQNEFWPFLELENEENYCPNVDLLIIGSDEVFNYAEAVNAGYSDDLFGNNQNSRRIISFAASFGCTQLQDLDRLRSREKIKNFLMRFAKISVRDMNSKRIVESLTGKECSYHLDPVFHFDYSPYMPTLKPRKPYLAVYAYAGLSEEFKKKIRLYAKNNKLEILSFMGYQSGLGRFMNVSPFELLSYMKNADCIVTTTFHGAVFSIKYNKPFCAIVQHRLGDGYGNDEKLGDLLIRTGLANHMIDLPEMIGETLETVIDYQNVNAYIDKTVKQGKAYLLSELSKD